MRGRLSKAVIVLVAVLFAISIVAGSAAAAPKKFKVGYSCISWTIPWMVYYKQLFEQEIKKYPNYEIVWHDAKFDNKAMVDAVEGWIAQKVDMIISFPLDHVVMIETYKKALKAGIPVFLTMDPPDYKAFEYMTAFSGLDGRDGSRMCAELFNAVAPNAKIGYITAPKGSASEQQYTEGFKVALQRLGSKVQIVAEEDGKWDVTTSYQKASDILTKFPNLDAFYTTDDYMGAGIIRALKEKGYRPGQVKIIAQGGSKTGVQDLKDGWYVGIVDQGPVLCVYQDIWFMRAMLEEGKKLPHFSMVRQELITKENVSRFPGTW